MTKRRSSDLSDLLSEDHIHNQGKYGAAVGPISNIDQSRNNVHSCPNILAKNRIIDVYKTCRKSMQQNLRVPNDIAAEKDRKLPSNCVQ